VDQIFSFAARYGLAGFICVLIFLLFAWWFKHWRPGTITLIIGNGKQPVYKREHGNDGNNGNGKVDEAMILKAIAQHQQGCAPLLHEKIEQYNREVTAKIDAYHTMVLTKVCTLEGQLKGRNG